MKAALPVPTLTATLLPSIGRQPREVVIHGEGEWQERIRRAPERHNGVHHCTRCGSRDHNVRRCESLAATKAILKARRR